METKTKAFHFFRWLSGEKDPYIGNLEMRPPEERIYEGRRIRFGIGCGKARWLWIRFMIRGITDGCCFSALYRIMAVIFCIMLAGLLLFTVSYLPPTEMLPIR